MSNVVQLEAFESSLKARRIRWFISPLLPTIYPPGFQEQLFTESPPFQRRILLTSTASSEAWKMTDKWDMILVPQTQLDWSLILTMFMNQPPPTLVIATPETRIPPQIFQRCAQMGAKAPTFICHQVLSQPLPPPPTTFDATFFPPAKDVEDVLMEAMQTALVSVLSAHKLGDFTVKDALKSLRGAGATLVVSSIEDAEPTLYWYYASEQKSRGKDLLTSVVNTLLHRG